MDKLDKAITDVACILDHLILLRQIQQTGNCNSCKNRDCGYIPKAGQMVRYNCPFYKAESNVFEDIIRDTPTTNIGRSSGEWISLGDNNYECSECHEKCYFPKLRVANYCFFCGAKMIEPQESEVENGND